KTQENLIKLIKPGVECSFLHQKATELLTKMGYKTENKQGFIHSLGHGLGLDIHEAPLISKFNDQVLEPGQVITIEPGLYYSDLGGVRLEDVVLVTNSGFRVLSDYPKSFLI
ncbi:MAG: M24 family metallopeptidase, partial [Candidatus Moranbacteria bacterium]|nr:M24 family metallopeptidase [Candidatus Moranbacteria bacterium]